MVPESARRFSFGDGFLLIAAVATGSFLEQLFRSNREFHHSTRAAELPILWSIENAANPSIVVLALFLFIARFLPPRPMFSRIARQPGTVACGLILFDFCRIEGWLLREAGHLNRYLPITAHGPVVGLTSTVLSECIGHSGRLIALLWITMALTRSWSHERSWIDRSGRCLGWIAIADAYIRSFAY